MFETVQVEDGFRSTLSLDIGPDKGAVMVTFESQGDHPTRQDAENDATWVALDHFSDEIEKIMPLVAEMMKKSRDGEPVFPQVASLHAPELRAADNASEP